MELKRFLGTFGHYHLGFLWSEFTHQSFPPPRGGGITKTNRVQLVDLLVSTCGRVVDAGRWLPAFCPKAKEKR